MTEPNVFEDEQERLQFRSKIEQRNRVMQTTKFMSKRSTLGGKEGHAERQNYTWMHAGVRQSFWHQFEADRKSASHCRG